MLSWKPGAGSPRTDVAQLADGSELHLVIGDGQCTLVDLNADASIHAIEFGDESAMRAHAETLAREATGTLEWRDGGATLTTRTEVATVGDGIEYHLVIGQSLATLVRVSDQNTALACGDPDDMRARAEEFAANDRPEPAPARALQSSAPVPAPTLSAADMINDLPKIDQIATAVDQVIRT